MNHAQSLATAMTAAPAPRSYEATLVRLNRASAAKHYDAYADITWDAPEYRIDPEDPRFERDANDPLGATAWYRALPQPKRARLGLALLACQMKMGVAFESILARGLLEFAGTLQNGAPEFRYAYHEVIEEGQHSLMFQECINRTGMDVPGIEGVLALAARTIPRLGRVFPELFFLHVLAGETPIDHVQRTELARGDALHPLAQRIMQIHVTEEARHVCFATRYLEHKIPRLSALRMWQLRLVTPFALQQTAALMLRPPSKLLASQGVPKAVVREAYSRNNPAYRSLVADGLKPIRTLCMETGVVLPELAPLWKALGIWSAPAHEKALPSGKSPLLAP